MFDAIFNQLIVVAGTVGKTSRNITVPVMSDQGSSEQNNDESPQGSPRTPNAGNRDSVEDADQGNVEIIRGNGRNFNMYPGNHVAILQGAAPTHPIVHRMPGQGVLYNGYASIFSSFRTRPPRLVQYPPSELEVVVFRKNGTSYRKTLNGANSNSDADIDDKNENDRAEENGNGLETDTTTVPEVSASDDNNVLDRVETVAANDIHQVNNSMPRHVDNEESATSDTSSQPVKLEVQGHENLESDNRGAGDISDLGAPSVINQDSFPLHGNTLPLSQFTLPRSNMVTSSTQTDGQISAINENTGRNISNVDACTQTEAEIMSSPESVTENETTPSLSQSSSTSTFTQTFNSRIATETQTDRDILRTANSSQTYIDTATSGNQTRDVKISIPVAMLDGDAQTSSPSTADQEVQASSQDPTKMNAGSQCEIVGGTRRDQGVQSGDLCCREFERSFLQEFERRINELAASKMQPPLAPQNSLPGSGWDSDPELEGAVGYVNPLSSIPEEDVVGKVRRFNALGESSDAAMSELSAELERLLDGFNSGELFAHNSVAPELHDGNECNVSQELRSQVDALAASEWARELNNLYMEDALGGISEREVGVILARIGEEDIDMGDEEVLNDGDQLQNLQEDFEQDGARALAHPEELNDPDVPDPDDFDDYDEELYEQWVRDPEEESDEEHVPPRRHPGLLNLNASIDSDESKRGDQEDDAASNGSN